MPVRFSRVTPLSLSVSFCMSLNLGITAAMTAIMHTTSTITATAVVMVSSALEAFILHIAHIAIIGANISMRSTIMFAMCICWISLVVLVISDAVENLFISAIEKLSTFAYTLLLSVAERRLATHEADMPEATEQSELHTA